LPANVYNMGRGLFTFPKSFIIFNTAIFITVVQPYRCAKHNIILNGLRLLLISRQSRRAFARNADVLLVFPGS
jgi:hypothetical protein